MGASLARDAFGPLCEDAKRQLRTVDVELEPFDAERHASARLSWPHHLPHIESHYRCMHDAAFLAACCDALRPEMAEA